MNVENYSAVMDARSFSIKSIFWWLTAVLLIDQTGWNTLSQSLMHSTLVNLYISTGCSRLLFVYHSISLILWSGSREGRDRHTSSCDHWGQKASSLSPHNNSALNILSFFMRLCKSLLVDFCVCLDKVLHILTPGFLGKALAQKSELTFIEVFFFDWITLN